MRAHSLTEPVPRVCMDGRTSPGVLQANKPARSKDEGGEGRRGACVGHPLETRRRERVETAGVEH